MTVKEESIVDLPISLEHQVKRRKLAPKAVTNSKTTHDENVPLELSQCLKSFTSQEKLSGDSYKCQSTECGDTPQKARKHLTIKKLPPALCISLKVSTVI
jgi:ubiquitin carboxyl-terminal hydrolase 22/27/51